MRYLILSDIHSNLIALKEVLKKAKRIGYDEIICLGDFVGYYTSPNEVIEELKDKLKIAILGNHDYGILHPQSITAYFNEIARDALFYNIRFLSKDSLEFLKNSHLLQRLTITFSYMVLPQNQRNSIIFILPPMLHEKFALH